MICNAFIGNFLTPDLKWACGNSRKLWEQWKVSNKRRAEKFTATHHATRFPRSGQNPEGGRFLWRTVNPVVTATGKMMD